MSFKSQWFIYQPHFNQFKWFFKKSIFSIPNEDKCKEHNKDFSTYCKSCKLSLCTFCLNDDTINKKHAGHNLILYKDYIDGTNEQQKKLQFPTLERFSQYINKVEDTFNKNFNENHTKTVKTFEDFIQVLQNSLEEFKKKMEVKNNKRNTVMHIIKKFMKVTMTISKVLIRVILLYR